MRVRRSMVIGPRGAPTQGEDNLIAQDFRGTAAEDAGGWANDGRGKLALVPNERNESPLVRSVCREAQATRFGEQQLLGQILGAVRAAGYTLPHTLIVNYYVALKTNPFVILTGAAGHGKTELARLFAEALVGRDSPQYQLIPSAGGWPGGTGEDQYYRSLQAQFSSWRFIELLHEAALPSNLGKAYMVCFDALHPDELDYYFATLLRIAPTGEKRLNLPGFPADRQPIIPPNVYITATVNTAEHPVALSRNVLRHAGVIEFSTPQCTFEHTLLSATPPVPPSGYQRLWLRAALHDLHDAHARLVAILGRDQFDRLQYSPDLVRLVWRSGLALTQSVRHELTTYIANSFDAHGVGLFDARDPLRNAQIAYGAQVIQRFLWRLRDAADAELRRDLTHYFDQFTLTMSQQAVA